MNLFKNPWATLIIGLMVGLTLGYVLAERQPVPPSRAMAPNAGQAGLPPDHPPIEGGAAASASSGPSAAEQQQVREQAAELEGMLKQRPDDRQVMVALGNLYFDASQWPQARDWYEKALAQQGQDPNVLTDVAVVYRNLAEPEKALERLDRALGIAPDHWQALFNKVVVLNFDLHRHDEAAAALAKLKALKASNPQVPDLSTLERDVNGG